MFDRPHSHRRGSSALIAGLLLVSSLAACSSDDSDDGGPGPEPAPAAPEAEAASDSVVAELTELIRTEAHCEWLADEQCLFPFPSSRFEEEADTETGVRLALTAEAMPVNASGSAVDPAPWSQSDGWGVGTPIMVTIDDLDLAASGYATEEDPARSLTAESTSALVDLTTGERLAHWVERDQRPLVDSMSEEDQTTVLIRPVETLPEGHRIGVALGQPVTTTGDEPEPSTAFVTYRDNLTTSIDEVEERREGFEDLFSELGALGVERGDLWLAWEFGVMSTENLTGELIAMRDRAFEELGDEAPAYEVTEVLTETGDGGSLPDGVGKRIRGTFEVPSFLTGEGEPGTEFVRDDDGLPTITGTYEAEFTCSVTSRQLDGTAPARPVVYGHGLLGSYREAERGDLGTADADLMLCATYWVGMSDPDLGYAVSTLGDINGFPSVADRLRQGIVNQLFLARLIGHPDGIASDSELAGPDGDPSVDTTEVFYEGHSQGGIMGFAATAVSNEWSKAVIGVPGVNYSMLIPRSNNWAVYGPVIAGGYPGTVEGLIVLGLLQQLWDRGEGSGYVRHLTGGLPGTQDHQVIIQVALADHQVANATSDLAARTAGVPVRVPLVAEGRLPWALPPHGIDTVDAGEEADSLMVYWDAGTLAPPLGSLAPDADPSWTAACTTDTERESAPCADPHEFPRRTPEAQAQRNEFFATGVVVDTCGEGPCATEPRGG